MFATTGGGRPPASTSSKCLRARKSLRWRKKVRASSRRTRTSPGCSIRISRKAATASSSLASRSSSEAACSEDARASIPLRNNSLSSAGLAATADRVVTGKKTAKRQKTNRMNTSRKKAGSGAGGSSLHLLNSNAAEPRSETDILGLEAQGTVQHRSHTKEGEEGRWTSIATAL